MKRNRFIYSALMLCLVFFSFSNATALAQSLPSSQAPDSPTDGWVAIPHPDVTRLQIPANLDAAAAASLATDLVSAETRTLALKLSEQAVDVQTSPVVGGLALSIRTTGAQDAQQLTRAASGQTLTQVGDNVTDCARNSLQALSNEILALSRFQSQNHQHEVADVTAAPTVNMRYPDPNGWSYISGWTSANTSVTVSITRGGSPVANLTTLSDSRGDYAVSPTWTYNSCTPSSSFYNWTAKPGDTVVVTANSVSTSTVVAALSFWVDPSSDLVQGTTEANRAVEIDLMIPVNCAFSSTNNGKSLVKDLTSSSSGAFSYDWTSLVDFDNQAYSLVRVNYSSGTYTYYDMDAFHVNVSPGWKYVQAVLQPSEAYTFTHTRSGSVLQTLTGTTASDGSISLYTSNPINSGDILKVADSARSKSITVAGLTLTPNAGANTLSGTTAGSRKVIANIVRRTGGSVISSCSATNECLTTTSNGSGSFSVTTKYLDALPGDAINVYVMDSSGSYQYTSVSFPAIVAALNTPSVSGTWSRYDVSLTASLKDSAGTTLKTVSGITPNPNGGDFLASFAGQKITAGNTITVSDGSTSQSMTVQSLTGLLGAGALNGSTTAVHALAGVNGICKEADVASGAYSLDYQAYGIKGWNFADLYARGSDGHYTYRKVYTLSMDLDLTDRIVWGYTSTPAAAVTATLFGADHSTIETSVGQSTSVGYYELKLAHAPAQGMVLSVGSSDGQSAALTVPVLTITSVNAGSNQVSGTGPAGKPVDVSLWDEAHSQSVTVSAAADGSSGAYQAAFGGKFYPNCSPAAVGANCSLAISAYTQTNGQIVRVFVPTIPVDAYESPTRDDTQGAAKPYTFGTVATHNFDSYADVDWISLVITPAQVGQTFYLDAFGGSGQNQIVLTLHKPDTSTQSSQASSSPEIAWTPDSSGTYTLEVRPGPNAYLTCATSSYNFIVETTKIYLPLASK